MLRCEVYFSQLRHDSEISNGENVLHWVSNMVLKFHDDPTVNEPEIVVFSETGLVGCGKKKGF